MEIQDLIKRMEGDGKGEILRTQTTSLDLICVFDIDAMLTRTTFRIHYNRKREFDVHTGEFQSLYLVEEHPLLLEYTETMCGIQLLSSVEDKQFFLDEIDQAAKRIFCGWRAADNYSFMPLGQFIEESFGILMVAPKSYAKAVIEAAKKCKVKLIMDDGRDPQKPFPQVLLFDNWYVIADGFRIEEIS